MKKSTTPKTRRSSSRLPINTLEYGIIAGLVVKQYQQDEAVNFNALLSIPLTERIPGLMEAYGKKTMHKLLVMILKEFCHALPLPKAKKLTETKISMAACELMLEAESDYLSLEDVILFLQRAKVGRYGPIKSLAHPDLLFALMEPYRQARHEAYVRMKEQKNAALKLLGSPERTSPEPTSLNDLLQQAFSPDISNRA